MNTTLKSTLLCAAVMGLSAGLASVQAGDAKNAAKPAKDAGVTCVEKNSCHTKGSCKSLKNECAGKNSCANHEFNAKTEKDCTDKKGSVKKS